MTAEEDGPEHRLIARMASFDEQLAGRPESAESDAVAPEPGSDIPGWDDLQACIRLLRDSLAEPDARGGEAVGPLLPPVPTLFGRFRLIRELGRGGFGVVYLAEDPVLRGPVALKVPRPEALVSPDLRSRFLREARAAVSLDHPNIVPVYETGEVEGICYIAAAYCPGPTLAAWLRDQPGLVPVWVAAGLIRAIAAGVEHAHSRGVLHRDLKPGNIMLEPRPEPAAWDSKELPFVPRLTDFGLAKLAAGDEDRTTTGLVMGTPGYMAPEQMEGWAEAAGPRTDVYALGVMLYELLTRRLPHAGPSLAVTLEKIKTGEPVPPRSVRPDVPRALETVCLTCLARDQADRYPTAAAVAEDLARFLRGEPVRARPLTAGRRLRLWARHPDRIRDAGLINTLFVLVGLPVNVFGLLLFLFGAFTTQRWLPTVAFFVSQIVGYFCPMAWIALHTRERRFTPLLAGVVLALLHALFFVGVQLDLIDSGGAAGGTESVELAQVCTIVAMSLTVAGAYALALVAYFANRHIPGFVASSPPAGPARDLSPTEPAEPGPPSAG